MNNHESYSRMVIRLKKFGYLLLHKSLVRIKEYNKENIGDESVILAPNHTSDKDGPVFWSSISNLRIMAKKECFDNKAKGWFLTTIGADSVDRSKRSFRAVGQAVEYLNDKIIPKIYLIFPQGTISDINMNSTGRIKEGVFIMATLSNTPIVPAFIEQPRFLRRSRIVYGEKMYVKEEDVYLNKNHRRFNRDGLERLKTEWQQEVLRLQQMAVDLEGRPIRKIKLNAKHSNNNDGDIPLQKHKHRVA